MAKKAFQNYLAEVNENSGFNNLYTSFRIKDEYYPAVDNVTLEFNKNEILAIVGESGCGKSTLATSVIGLHNPINTK